MADPLDASDSLIFEMGLYKARIPGRLRYCEIHFWFDSQADGRTRIGLTAYAMRLLSDLFRLDWKVEEGQVLKAEQLLGEVESTKAVSDLYCPFDGKLTAINRAVLEDPSALSLDPYAGWLLEIEGAPADALSAEAYVQFLADGWEETVQMLKGQV